MWLLNRFTVFACALVMLEVRRVSAEESLAKSWVETIKKQAEEAIRPKTLGGRQFWGDVHHFQGWRIQQNVFTKHFRLIDPDDVRHSHGSLDECQSTLTKIVEEQNLPPMDGPAVILIH